MTADPSSPDTPGNTPPQASGAVDGRLSREDLETILAVTRALAVPFDLQAMLAEVTAAARRVLRADRSSVWLHDPVADELGWIVDFNEPSQL